MTPPLTLSSKKAKIKLNMDKNNNFFDIIRRISTGMYCPFCGTPFNTDKISFVGIGDGSYAVSLTCGKCSTPIMFSIIVGSKKDKLFPSVFGGGNEVFSEEEISLDEIINLHENLKMFDGDFKKVFNRRI